MPENKPVGRGRCFSEIRWLTEAGKPIPRPRPGFMLVVGLLWLVLGLSWLIFPIIGFSAGNPDCWRLIVGLGQLALASASLSVGLAVETESLTPTHIHDGVSPGVFPQIRVC